MNVEYSFLVEVIELIMVSLALKLTRAESRESSFSVFDKCLET